MPVSHVESGESSSSSGDAAGTNTPGGWLHESEPLRDPLIYPGLYAPSGFDMMGILVCCLCGFITDIHFPQ